MASARNGGDQGGAGEAPTRPKLLAGGAFVPPRGQGTQEAFDYEIRESSNWHAAQREGLAGADEYLDGVVDMEEEDIVELEPEEEEPTPAEMQRWRLRGRYISVKKPNIEDLTDHFNDVWHLRTGVNFAPLGKNWFTVTLFSEGDYNFVARGGPWIYRGYPLLFGKIVEGARPSETVLNSVPLWVQVYDVPWNRKKKSTAQLIGANLGKYLEVDLDADGRSPYDFLRVRIDIPVDRCLKPSITTQIPVLLHGGRPVCKSLVILQYLEDSFPGAGNALLPANPYDRAVACFWVAYADDIFFAAWIKSLKGTTEDEKAAGTAGALAALQTLEGAFRECSQGKPFFTGNEPGYVDVALGGYLGWMPAY
ncbi:hypothetical protein ACQ4PT_024054 [Festuca glaucescens]